MRPRSKTRSFKALTRHKHEFVELVELSSRLRSCFAAASHLQSSAPGCDFGCELACDVLSRWGDIDWCEGALKGPGPGIPEHPEQCRDIRRFPKMGIRMVYNGKPHLNGWFGGTILGKHHIDNWYMMTVVLQDRGGCLLNEHGQVFSHHLPFSSSTFTSLFLNSWKMTKSTDEVSRGTSTEWPLFLAVHAASHFSLFQSLVAFPGMASV